MQWIAKIAEAIRWYSQGYSNRWAGSLTWHLFSQSELPFFSRDFRNYINCARSLKVPNAISQCANLRCSTTLLGFACDIKFSFHVTYHIQDPRYEVSSYSPTFEKINFLYLIWLLVVCTYMHILNFRSVLFW